MKRYERNTERDEGDSPGETEGEPPEFEVLMSATNELEKIRLQKIGVYTVGNQCEFIIFAGFRYSRGPRSTHKIRR